MSIKKKISRPQGRKRTKRSREVELFELLRLEASPSSRWSDIHYMLSLGNYSDLDFTIGKNHSLSCSMCSVEQEKCLSSNID